MTSRYVRWAACGVALAVLMTGTPVAAQVPTDSVVLRWNAAALDAVRRSTLPPPAVARALAILHTCIYDAWAVYDPIASGVHYHEKDLFTLTDDRRERAVSYAAHRALVDLFPAERALFDGVMMELGYDPADLTSPDATRGAEAAQAGLDVRVADGANQGGGYADITARAICRPTIRLSFHSSCTSGARETGVIRGGGRTNTGRQ